MSGKLASLVRNATLHPTTDYYKGSSFLYPVKPTNVVCFRRSFSSELHSTWNKRQGYHHRFVLITAVEGHGHVCIDTKKFFVKEGQSLLVFPFQFHHYLNIEPNRICWLFVTFEMHHLEGIESLRLSGPRNLGDRERTLLETFLDEWISNKSSPSIGYYLALILQHLSLQKIPQTARNTKRPPKDDLLLKINHYLLPRLNRPILLEEVATAIGISESHLRASFLQSTQTSLGNHIRLLRMQKAAGMLLQTSDTISEISDKCGFDSLYSFSRSFKSIYSISPRTYRQKLGA